MTINETVRWLKEVKWWCINVLEESGDQRIVSDAISNFDNSLESIKHVYNKGRTDAINEFTEKCIELQRELFVNPSVNELDLFKIWLCNVAEMLKNGGKNMLKTLTIEYETTDEEFGSVLNVVDENDCCLNMFTGEEADNIYNKLIEVEE